MKAWTSTHWQRRAQNNKQIDRYSMASLGLDEARSEFSPTELRLLNEIVVVRDIKDIAVVIHGRMD
jgi:hypothetical protein